MKIQPQMVYDALLEIPRGRVTTYGAIARHLGNIHYARVIGNILHNNPEPDVYPCFKVVNSKGKLAAHFGDGGLTGQKQRLQNDGITVENGMIDLDKYFWGWSE